MSDNDNSPAVPPKVTIDQSAKLNATVRMQPEESAKLNATVRIQPEESAKLNATVRIQPIDGISAAHKRPEIHRPGLGGPKAPSVPTLSVGGAQATTPAAAIEAAKKLTGSLKSVTGPIPAQAVLHKTGIIAEGLPSDSQAAKSKTSRISLNDAMGVAPTRETAAPLKTIRLKRPTGLPAAPASAPAAPAPAAPEPAASVTQKKTLKLHRPGGVGGVKRPSIGIKRPDAAPAAPAAAPAGDGVADLGEVAELDPTATVTTTQTAVFQPAAPSRPAGVPKWLLTLSVISTLAALVVFGVATFFMVIEGMGTQVNDLGYNDTAFIQTEEDHHIDMR